MGDLAQATLWVLGVGGGLSLLLCESVNTHCGGAPGCVHIGEQAPRTEGQGWLYGKGAFERWLVWVVSHGHVTFLEKDAQGNPKVSTSPFKV